MNVSSSSSSSSSALGNTSLKGFGGLASGLDRDALIEQLTLNTNNKLTKTQQNITKQEWRQEAYNSITDQMIDMEDDYLSYSGKTSIVNNDLYTKSVVTAKGNSASTSLLSATGSSNLLEYVSVKGVSQLASSSYFTSKKMTVGDTDTTATKSTKLSELTGFDEDNIKKMTINGKSFELTGESTVNDLVKAINSSDAGVKATYVESTGSFMFFDKETGKESDIELSPEAEALFGDKESHFTAGKDAEMYVSYGGSEPVKITSHTNTFNVDGLKVTASGTFGNIQDDGSGNVSYDASASVSFTATANVDKATERVKAFVEAYNKMVEEVNTHVTTRPAKGYDPLTEEQEEEMTEKEIEKWTKKAKEGILYNDNEIRDFAFELHGMMNDIVAGGISYSDLESIGITISSDHADGGQLTFDEDKFRQAMESDSEKVEEIMCGSEGKTGFGQTINKQLTPYATRYASRNGNSYGRLIEVAGSEKLVATKNKNEIYDKIQGFNSDLDKWKAKLKVEEDRYLKQFSNLEKLINSMNTQSNYLSGLSY